MAAVLPEGKQQYTNAAGLPLVGGKVWTYDAGTNTPRTTWSDAAETAPNANPVILDARGEATIFWRGAYKVVLRDASDNIIWTVDGVSGADTSVSALQSSLASQASASAGAGLIGYQHSLAYPAGTVGAKLRQFRTPEDAGADGTGATEATAAIQSLLTAGFSIRGVPGSTYLIGPLTASTAGQVIDMRGCTLRRKNASAHAAMLTLNAARQVAIGGRWDGNKANQSGTVNDRFGHAAVTIVGDECTVSEISEFDSWGIGIKGNGCAYPTIFRNRSTGADLYGIYVESTSVDEYGCDISFNIINSVGIPGASGIYLTGSNAPFTFKQRDWAITGNLCIGNTTGSPTGIAITTRGVDGVINGNRTVGYTMGISADIAQMTPITGNRCVDAAGPSAYGIELNGSNCDVVGNVVRGGRFGIIGSGNSTTQDYSLIGSNIVSGPSVACIYFNGVSQPARFLNITGNTLIMSGSTTGRRGVLLEGNCADSMVHNNLIAGPGSAVSNCRAVYLDSVPGYVSVMGNRFSGWERVLALYAGSAFTYTDIAFNVNDCTRDCGSALNFVSTEGSATIGARVTQMWNTSGSGVNYNVLDFQAMRLLQWSASFVTPEANVTGGIGSLYINLNGGAGTTFFVKQSGTGNTGWAGK